MSDIGKALQHPAVIAVIAAGLTIVGNTIAAGLAQRDALRLAELQDRREIALQLMQAPSKQAALEKLQTLEAAGLYIDVAGGLREGLERSNARVYPVPCIKSADIGPEPEQLKLTGNAKKDLLLLAPHALEMRAQIIKQRALMLGCVAD